MTITFNFRKKPNGNLIVFDPLSLEEGTSTWVELPPGVYNIQNMSPLGFVPAFEEYIQKDNLVKFSSGVVKEMIKKADWFFSDGVTNAYKELQVCHKMGILLYGPPGTGKTCLSVLVMKEMVEKYKAICIIATTNSFDFMESVIKLLRKVHPTIPIVLFVDEVENHIASYERWYLSLLDGSDSVDKFIFIGCTNYLDKIPDRIKNRKSRIKYKYEVKGLAKEVYEEYISSKLPGLSKDKLAEFVYRAMQKNLTIDQTKHALIDYHVDGVSITKAIRDSSKLDEVGCPPCEENNSTGFINDDDYKGGEEDDDV